MKQLILGTVAALSLTTAANADTLVYTVNAEQGGFNIKGLNAFQWPYIPGCIPSYCNTKFYYDGVGYDTHEEAVAAGAADLEAAGEALALAAMGGMEGPTEAEANEAEEINDAQANIDGTYGPDLELDTIVQPLTETSSTFVGKFSTVLTALEEVYGPEDGQALFNHVFQTGYDNSVIRLDQMKENIEFYQDGNLIAYTAFDGEIAGKTEDLTASINAYQYQVQNGTDQKRIRLLNNDGSAATDYIQADNITDLIVNLSKETFNQGFADGFYTGYQSGYVQGYADGFIDGVNSVIEPIE